jgi:hypothetical protein
MSNNAAQFHSAISFFFHIPEMRRKMKDIYCNGPPPQPLTETSQCLCPQSIKTAGKDKEKNPSINPIVAAVIV